MVPPPDRRASSTRYDELAHHLRTTIGRLVRATRSVDSVSPAVSTVLELLHQHGSMTTAELAAARRVKHQSIAVMVGELQQAGYVRVLPHPTDRRAKLNSLTPAGEDAYRADQDKRERLLARTLAEVADDGELDALRAALLVLDRVNEKLTGRAEEPTGFFRTGAW